MRLEVTYNFMKILSTECQVRSVNSASSYICAGVQTEASAYGLARQKCKIAVALVIRCPVSTVKCKWMREILRGPCQLVDIIARGPCLQATTTYYPTVGLQATTCVLALRNRERIVDSLVHLFQRLEKLAGAQLLLEPCLVDRFHVPNDTLSQGQNKMASRRHARVEGNRSASAESTRGIVVGDALNGPQGVRRTSLRSECLRIERTHHATFVSVSKEVLQEFPCKRIRQCHLTMVRRLWRSGASLREKPRESE